MSSGQRLIAQMNTFTPPAGALALWGLGQMGVALKGNGGEMLYIDPCLSDVVAIKVPQMSDKFARAFPPPIAPEEVTNASYVLCSHEHLDHSDPLTLAGIAKASPQAKFVITGWSFDVTDEAGIDRSRCIVPPSEQSIQLGSFQLTATPSAHYQVEFEAQKGHRWLGFWLEGNGVTFYHSGDTIIYPGYIDGLKKLPQAEVAMVAANGRDAYRDSFGVTGNLLPAEAAWLAQELGWDLLIGGHNDLFAWNAIGAGELAEAVHKQNPRQKMHVLQPGELFVYVK